MKGFGLASATAAAIAVTSLFARSVTATVDPIVIKGSKFFFKTNGTEFFIRGVAYQQDYSGNGTTVTNSSVPYVDPLANEADCMRDIPFLQQLMTNTVRVYAVDPTANHDACMNAFAAAGIYVIADLSAPVTGQSIDRSSPAWTDETYERYTSVVDSLAQYTNTLGFFAGNEVSNAANNTAASAFVKAAVRDIKAYIVRQNYRPIGVGYATNDDADIRVDLANYFDCGEAADAVDFWGYNIYSWCGDSNYVASGYQARTQEFSSYNVPAFFAEYGCNTPSPRVFTEVQALFGPQMTPVWSGGIVYMYFQEANNFGLVNIDGNTVTPNQDFKNLQSQLAKISPTGVQSASYNPTNSPQACPAVGSDWGAASSPLPPTPNAELCGCMYDSLSCVVSADTNEDDYGTLFGTVCGFGADVCAGIAANSTTGTYGAYGMCNSTEQLAYAFNNYYVGQSSSASACGFGGAATIKAATSATGACSALINEAGTAGTGTVTSVPTGSGGAGSGGAASSSGGAGMNPVPSMDFGLLPMAMAVTLAAISGAGMILL